jgi:DNA helicase II / ATP-dependent DNA helicase PcrA
MKTYKLKTRHRKSAEFTIEYSRELNEAQCAAATHKYGPHLVIAGAGTGKTQTIVYRVAHMIESGINPASILLLTFTRKAAYEMMQRASRVLDERCQQIRGGTFHSFANSILRRHAWRLGYDSTFSVLDRGDAEDIIALVRSQYEKNQKKRRFPKKNVLLSIFSKMSNTDVSLDQIVDRDYPHYKQEKEEIAQCRVRYQEYKKARHLMDYDDLLINLLALLQQTDIATLLSSEHQFVMIDEYQDMNVVQAEIARRLVTSHNNIFVVGDDAQSIYSFRGADIQNIMNFPLCFPGCTITKLERNYRSTAPILLLTNALIASAKQRYVKNLYTSETETEDSRPVFLRPETTGIQADFVAQRILELREEGLNLSDIAVLFRSGWHSNELEVVLNDYGIPYVKYGGLRFTEAAHIKDTVGFLRVLHNHVDVVAWSRILQLHEGIGPKTTSSLVEQITTKKSLHDALNILSASDKKVREKVQKLGSFLRGLEEIRDDIAGATRRIAEYYYPLLQNTYDDHVQRTDDIESLISIAERYSSLNQFLDDLAIEPPEQSHAGAEASTQEEGKVVLSTVHSAKGLEWHSVFVINLIDGFFPSSHSLDSTETEEEERRLLYVACTRAKQALYLSAPHLTQRSSFLGGGGLVFSEVSRFLRDLKPLEKFVEEWRIA